MSIDHAPVYGAEPLVCATESGPAHIVLDRPFSHGTRSSRGRRSAPAAVVLGHGAGGDVDAPDLLAVRDVLVGRGVAVARVRQPYRVRGSRAPERAPKLDAAFTLAVRAVVEETGAAAVVVGGRSSGARVACRTASALGAVGVVALAFPLRPPGRDVTRADELAVAGCPVLVVQGTRDAFGTPEDVRSAASGLPWVSVHPVDGADHSFRARKADGRTSADCALAVGDAVAAWITPILTKRT